MEPTDLTLPKELWNVVIDYCIWNFSKMELLLSLVCKAWKSTVVKLVTYLPLEDHGSKLDKIFNQWPYLARVHLPRYGAGITSLAPLQNLSHLRSLTLIYKPNDLKIQDYDIIATLTQLTELTTSAYTKDPDLLKLSTLTNLLSLDLGSFGYAYSSTSKGFDALKGMTRLTHFYTPGSGWNTDCSEKISHLTNLKSLRVQQGGSSDVFAGARFLSNLTNLENAVISCYSTSSEEIEHLKHWTNLTSLRLSKVTSGQHFGHLSSLGKLRKFGLSQFQLIPWVFETLAKWPVLQTINFEHQVNWLAQEVDHEEGSGAESDDEEEELLEDPWDRLTAVTALTNLRKLIRLPYHSELNTRITLFPQSIRLLNVLGLKGKTCGDFIKSLLHFTKLDSLVLKGVPESITNDTIEIIAQMTSLRHLTIYSDAYDYYSYRAWKNLRTKLDLDPENDYNRYKYKCYTQLTLAAFSCLTQLNTLYVEQDPFEEDELWSLTTLTHLKKISFGWYFYKSDFRAFLSLPALDIESSDEESFDSDAEY